MADIYTRKLWQDWTDASPQRRSRSSLAVGLHVPLLNALFLYSGPSAQKRRQALASVLTDVDDLRWVANLAAFVERHIRNVA
jgi:hypothetical protein